MTAQRISIAVTIAPVVEEQVKPLPVEKPKPVEKPVEKPKLTALEQFAITNSTLHLGEIEGSSSEPIIKEV